MQIELGDEGGELVFAGWRAEVVAHRTQCAADHAGAGLGCGLVWREVELRHGAGGAWVHEQREQVTSQVGLIGALGFEEVRRGLFEGEHLGLHFRCHQVPNSAQAFRLEDGVGVGELIEHGSAFQRLLGVHDGVLQEDFAGDAAAIART